ncbi:MAG TPA: hypothetical protein VFP84_30155 [Kofleriaceae bacterium]|nr:hypothetical protein [Kofleriaceae bacterium]
MRILPIAIALVSIATPIAAVAKPKPKIALAPLEGDAGNKVGQAIAASLGKEFVVIAPKDTKRELTKIGAGDELEAKDVKKATSELGAVAIIDGKLGKAGKKRSLHLEVHRRGKPDAGFTIEFKTVTEGFKRGVHDEIVKKLDGAGDDADEPVADEEAPTKHRLTDDDAPRKAKKPDADPDGDADARPGKKIAKADKADKADEDDAAQRPKKPAKADSDDAAPKRGKGKKVAAAEVEAGADGDETGKVKHTLGKDAPSPQPLARVDAGASVSQRRLSWGVRGGLTPAQTPPPVVTSSGGVRIDGEIYPFALANPSSSAAGLGFAALYDKSFGLAIKVPGTNVTSAINQSHYSFGARYRINVGEASSIGLGLDYFGRTYIADRGGLAQPTVLDTPDFSYKAVSPSVAARTPLTPMITFFGVLDGLLMFDAGPAVKNNNYGTATVYGVELHTGLDIAFTKQIGLRVAAEYSQINLSFGGKGTMATGRDGDPATQDVMSATDRSIGVAATLGLTY